MARHRSVQRHLVPSLLLLLGVSCGSSSPEQQVLIDFFQLARLGDHTRLARIATTTFDPNVDGSVDTFARVRIGTAESRTLDMTEGSGDRALAIASLTPPGHPDVAVDGLHVSAERKAVLLDAALRPAAGPPGRAQLAVTLERASARVGESMREGRWIVTRVQRQPGHQP